MANANVKIGVTGVSQFKQGINQAKDAVKTLDATLERCEKQFKETGDQEAYLAEKSGTLQNKLKAQERVAKELESAMKKMKDQGVSPSSAAYQKLYQELEKTKGRMSDTKVEIKNLTKEEEKAGNKAETLKDKLAQIGQGVGWDNVAEGIEKVTGKLESGARAAINFGKKIIQSAKGSTGLADDINTAVNQYKDLGMTADRYQRMTKVADFIDTPVDAILNAQQRMRKAAKTNGGKSALEETLGLKLNGQSSDDLFWEVGEALMSMGDAFDKESAAQTMFGRSWRELAPLFQTGRTEYERMLEEQTVLTDEQLKKLNDADDAIKKVEQQIELLKAQFWADNAETLTGVLEWIVDNKDAVVTAIEAIGVAFAGLKIAEFAANMGKIVSGFKLLMGAGAAGTAGAAGAAGASGAGTAGATTAAGLGWAGWAGLAGAVGIGAGFAAAANARNNHAETVRGTNEHLAAQSAGTELLLANYLNAEKAKANIDWMKATEAEAATIQAQVEATRQKLMEASGGAEALQAYSDWRQEHSYGNNYWELPDTLAQAVQELTGGADKQAQRNSEMAQAAQGLQGLPGQLANAVSQAMSGIGISIDGNQLIAWINSRQATMVGQ